MSEFNNVTVVREANIYFDGQVSSRTILFSDGSKKTLGLMLPGEYRFNTEAPELMEILAGSLEFRLAESDKWQAVEGGGAFEVPGNTYFDIKIHQPTDYCCSYID